MIFSIKNIEFKQVKNLAKAKINTFLIKKTTNKSSNY